MSDLESTCQVPDKTSVGKPYPFGASVAEDGVNFVVFSEHAHNIELCLFDELGQRELRRFTMHRGENYIWHVFVHSITAGIKYGYRAYGDYLPEEGLRFNHHKLLIDPYARQLDRSFTWDKSVLAYDTVQANPNHYFNELNSAAMMPKSIVVARKTVDEIADIQSRKPYTPWRDTLIYEAHVRGFTQLNLDVPAEQRGTFAGIAHPSSIEYMTSLGITAIELLPIHAFIDEEFLVKKGLSNYWGYNTLNFFSPHHSYMQGSNTDEFLHMVEALHAADIEVILDVVYNHTAESNEFGPTLSFRGLDNLSYYRLMPDKKQHYINDTGCGNTVQVDHPRVMQLILDSLRYWAGEMGVDGFRFDLASILGRDKNGFDRQSAFFQAISQDPLLSTCKLIAEPWDIGPGGYQLGAYPSEWSEWNDKFRDISRRFWRGDEGVMPEFARRIHGSADMFDHSGRAPRSSINLVTSHDGFTLADLVSYKERHNLANNENNKDGHHSNFSDNYGVEGPTKNKDILALRLQQQRNFIATLFLSQGIPMLLAGDEFGRTQLGNNNAYCQDNEMNWLNWNVENDEGKSLCDFTKYVINLRKRYSLFSAENYIHTPENLEKEHRCVHWFRSSGDEMTQEDWHQPDNKVLGWMLKEVSPQQKTVLFLLFNASDKDLIFTLPHECGVNIVRWSLLLDTKLESGLPSTAPHMIDQTVSLAAQSMLVLEGHT